MQNAPPQKKKMERPRRAFRLIGQIYGLLETSGFLDPMDSLDSECFVNSRLYHGGVLNPLDLVGPPGPSFHLREVFSAVAPPVL